MLATGVPAGFVQDRQVLSLADLFSALWADYAALTPQAHQIHALLEARGETVWNDHIALRTFDLTPVGMGALAAPFVAGGYAVAGHYRFAGKKLDAVHLEHPDRRWPKVFISALRVAELPVAIQDQLRALVAQVPVTTVAGWGFPVSGRPWQVSFATYEQLRAVSEYAAWVAAFGFRANHFTVDVGRLHTFDGLLQLDRFLLDQGFRLNDRGGLIKGSPALYLEQSSTLADLVPVEFSDRVAQIRSCYYEFARRYRMPSGELFQGFIADSADKIFESTDLRAGTAIG